MYIISHIYWWKYYSTLVTYTMYSMLANNKQDIIIVGLQPKC